MPIIIVNLTPIVASMVGIHPHHNCESFSYSGIHDWDPFHMNTLLLLQLLTSNSYMTFGIPHISIHRQPFHLNTLLLLQLLTSNSYMTFGIPESTHIHTPTTINLGNGIHKLSESASALTLLQPHACPL
jgi:hypothetical protein